MNFCNCTIGGNLTRDPATKPVGDNTVCNFAVAVNGRNEGEVTFYEVAAWGRRGEVIAEHFSKGDPIVVWGPLRLDEWEGNDGSTRVTLRLTAEGFSFAGSKRDQGGPVNNAAGNKRSGSRSQAGNYGDPVSSEEIPF